MATIQIKSLEPKNQITTLCEKETHQILGGDTWHVYYNKRGEIIASIFVDDNTPDHVEKHKPPK